MIIILNQDGHLFFEQIQQVVKGYVNFANEFNTHINDESIHKTLDGSDLQYISYSPTIKQEFNYKIENNSSTGTGNNSNNSTIQNITESLIASVKDSMSDSISQQLTEDELVFLPITNSPEIINEKINSYPKNLNGHSIIFVFTVPKNYHKDVLQLSGEPFSNYNTQYILNVGNENIKFENFFNGNLIIIGDYLHDSNFTTGYFTPSEKSDPDEISKNLYIQKIYQEIINPEKINNIINSESGDDNLKQYYKKIIIKGSSLNEEYSVLVLNNINAKTYVKNLLFEQSLPTDKNDEGKVDISLESDEQFPTENKLLIFYPLENDLTPIFGNTFNDEMLKYQNNILMNTTLVSSLSNISANIQNIIDLFKTKTFSTNRKINL